MNRIYIGSVMFDISEKDLEAVFQTFGPVKALNMIAEGGSGGSGKQRHKGYGFIEYETPDAAQLAIDVMNGAELGGRPIKAGRPTNYPTELPPGLPPPLPQRIYVANIHELVQEEELQRVFAAFGPLRHCRLIPDPLLPGKHRGYAYVEFGGDGGEEGALAAIQALNGFELAGRILRVGRTVVGGPLPPGMGERQARRRQEEQARGVPQAVLRAAEAINATLTSKNSTALAVAKPPHLSAVVALSNVETFERLQGNPNLVAELEEEMAEECGKCGPVQRVRVHLNPALLTAKVFVQFQTHEQALQAITLMHQRWFDGRQIVAELYDEQAFLALS